MNLKIQIYIGCSIENNKVTSLPPKTGNFKSMSFSILYNILMNKLGKLYVHINRL